MDFSAKIESVPLKRFICSCNYPGLMGLTKIFETFFSLYYTKVLEISI